MNSFWLRASRQSALDTIYDILKVELEAERDRKGAEIARFEALRGDQVGLAKYISASGLTVDICRRILMEVTRDNRKIDESQENEKIAVYGENRLGSLFSTPGKSKWTKETSGCWPVDILIVREDNPSVLMGDCKFGLKSENAWIFRNKDQYGREFARKFKSVGDFLHEYDNITPSDMMLLIVTSSLAPLLINRFEDFKLDPTYSDIPYDKIVVCSVDDIVSKAEILLPEHEEVQPQ